MTELEKSQRNVLLCPDQAGLDCRLPDLKTVNNTDRKNKMSITTHDNWKKLSVSKSRKSMG
jgi:hypothetical protein